MIPLIQAVPIIIQLCQFYHAVANQITYCFWLNVIILSTFCSVFISQQFLLNIAATTCCTFLLLCISWIIEKYKLHQERTNVQHRQTCQCCGNAQHGIVTTMLKHPKSVTLHD